jgi:hypothetical protein
MTELIRCYQCVYYKPISQYKGWCTDTREGRKKIRVNAVDYCDNAVKKEEAC